MIFSKVPAKILNFPKGFPKNSMLKKPIKISRRILKIIVVKKII